MQDIAPLRGAGLKYAIFYRYITPPGWRKCLKNLVETLKTC